MLTILIADDDDKLREGLAKYLRRQGHRVLMAADGRQVLATLRQEDDAVDVVLTDLNMPDVDGLEVIRELRRVSPGIPVIAMSGGGLFNKHMLLESAGVLGAVAILEKPFELTRLEETIMSVVRSDS